MMWFLDRKSESQADGDPRDHLPDDMVVMEVDESKTRYEPYPRMSSVEREEQIYLLKAKVEALDKRVADLESHV